MRGEVKGGANKWRAVQCTEWDLLSGKKWPFNDNEFDMVLCSHCLEDLRDPLPALAELCRVAKKVMILAPSRLLEQTRGIDHPSYCGFAHHPWILEQDGDTIKFRRKTAILELHKYHLVAPVWGTLKREYGSAMFYGDGFDGREAVFWGPKDDYNEYVGFIEPFKRRKDLWTAKVANARL